MTAAAMPEQAKSARVTGTAGALVVAIAFAMMAVASPSHAHSRPQVRVGPVGPAAVVSAQTVAQFTQAVAPTIGARP
jgi:hypothetical protein